MNSANQNTANEISPLKARLNRMGIHVPGNNPSPLEVIPVIEARLAAHMQKISRTASSTSGDYIEWKNIHDAYHELLADLRAMLGEDRARACPARASARAASAPKPCEQPTVPCVPPSPKNITPMALIPPTSSPKKPSQSQPTVPTSLPATPAIKPFTPPAPSSPPSTQHISPPPGHHPSHSSHPSYSTSHSTSTPSAPAKPPVIPPVPLNLIKKSSRSDDRIANLPPEDQAQIIHWFSLGLTYTRIIELAAQPRPEGLDLRLSRSMLCRFYQKNDLAEKIADAADLVAELCPDGAQNLEAALEILAQTHAVHAMATPALDHAGFRQLSRYLLRQQENRLRQRSLDLREKRLSFEMQWKHYDIFKRTIEKLPEINEIVRNQSLTPEQKFREHWIKTFGIDTVEMVERANKKWAEQHPDQHHTSPDYSDADVIPPLTPEEEQAVVNEALEVMLGKDAGDETQSLPVDTSDQPAPS